MITALVPLILEAALRALLAAVAVWAGLRLLSVGNVVVQKTAWGLVLVAALAMPFAPHWQSFPALAAVRLPELPRVWLRSEAPAPLRVQVPAPAPDRYPAPSISTSKFSERESYAPPQNAASDLDLPSSGFASEPAQGLKDAGFSLKDKRSGMEDTGSSLKSAGLSTYLNRPKKYRVLAPETPHSQSQPPPIPISAASTTVARPSTARINLAALGWLLYLGVFAALLVRLLFGIASALRVWMTADSVLAPDAADTVGKTPLRFSLRVASPVNIGSGIVLPADYAEWEEEKLRIVLAHERSHIRQGDFYLQILAGIYAALFWFSPLGWWLKRKLSELSEAISDRAGLEVAASRSSYAQLLLEFAALPRPTLTGVAMARTSHLAQRIERLLNESSFRQAFAGGGRRALLAVFLVPVALFAATALVRVEAAAAPLPQVQAAPQAQDAPQPATVGQSTPEQVTAPVPPAGDAPVPPPAPSPSAADIPGPPQPPPAADGGSGPGAMAPMPPNPATEAMPPMPPMPDIDIRVRPDIRVRSDTIHVHIDPGMAAEIAEARADAEKYFGNDFDSEAYALVGDPGTKPRHLGRWDDDRAGEIEKARKVAHGHFLWFRRDGKSYIIDDPAIVSQLEAMDKPMDDLREQMHALGEQMRAAGEQQRELGKQMREISVPTPDLTKEMAELNAAVATLQAKQGGTISQKDLGDLQREFGRIQGELGALEGKIGAQQGALGGSMGKFGDQMGKLGGQMGKLGSQMGQIARENRDKTEKVIDESLKDGKAKPVE